MYRNLYNFHTIYTWLLYPFLLDLGKENERIITMKKVLLSLLVIIVALGLLGAAGYAGYRYGFIQGMTLASNGASGNKQPLGPGFGVTPRGMPMHNFGSGRGFERDGFGMMQRGRGFGFFPLFGMLAQLLFWGLIIAGIVWLIARSGWRLTRTARVAAAPPAPVVETAPPAPEDENQAP
jgi:hypothetical protein